jgi:hypothetical protein
MTVRRSDGARATAARISLSARPPEGICAQPHTIAVEVTEP